jgi:glycosyltransferase involved in cell wall biosynthesis
LEWTAAADVGYVGQPPRTLNQRLNLANKLFENLMAGVPVVAAAGTEHCRVVEADGVGICVDAEQPEAIAAGIARLLDQPSYERERLRQHSRAVALARHSWEREQTALVELYRRLASPS